MIPGGSKERSAQQYGYFEETFKRIMDGESYSDPIRMRRLQRRKAAQLDIGKPFLPSNGDKLRYAHNHSITCWIFESCSFSKQHGLISSAGLHHVCWFLFIRSADSCSSCLLTPVHHVCWLLFIMSADSYSSCLLTPIHHVCWLLFIMSSGGLTTGPLGPGPQAPELQGAPKFSTNNFLGHNH